MIVIDCLGLTVYDDKDQVINANAKIKVGGKFVAKELSLALAGLQNHQVQIVDGLFKAPPEAKPVREKLAEIAEAEGKKALVWDGEQSEAEKYLKLIRESVGMSKGRFPWCGAFVHWCCEQAGISIPDSFPTGYTAAYVPAWEAWAKSNKWWYSSRLKADEFNPQTGDIVVFDWNADAIPDHIGIVLSYDGKRTLKTAEGNTSADNQSNGNSTAIRTRDWNVCRGFIRLPLEGMAKVS